jgi:hypothetical protein
MPGKVYVVMKSSPFGGGDVEAVCTTEDHVRWLMDAHAQSHDAGMLRVYERRLDWSFKHGDLGTIQLSDADG